MTLKGLYIVFADEQEARINYPGVMKKIDSQMKVLTQLDCIIEPLFVSISNDKIMNKISLRLPYEIFGDNYEISLSENIDFIYIRKPLMNYSVFSFIKKLKRILKCKCILEVPTYPYDQEIDIANISQRIYLKKDRKYRIKLNGIVDRIITFSDDDNIWGIPTLRISNGIETSAICPSIYSGNSGEINMIAVATHNFWHGYDRLLKGLVAYNKNEKKSLEVFFHIVGDGPIISEYKKIVEEGNIEGYVHFYGNLVGEELDSVYNKCNIGIDALARHRSGVFYNSSLKGKEYCAKGLPIISGVQTELDRYPAYKYYLRVPADETTIDINLIINFYLEIVGDKYEYEQVSREIRVFAEQQFEFKYTLMPIMNYLKSGV